MNSVPTLKSSVIAKFEPERLNALITEMERRGFNFRPIIVNDLARFNTNIEEMTNYNLDYAGWWGCPHRVEAYTIRTYLRNDYYLRNDE